MVRVVGVADVVADGTDEAVEARLKEVEMDLEQKETQKEGWYVL